MTAAAFRHVELLPPEPVEKVVECDGINLPDVTFDLKKSGWLVESITKLPAELGYRLHAKHPVAIVP